MCEQACCVCLTCCLYACVCGDCTLVVCSGLFFVDGLSRGLRHCGRSPRAGLRHEGKVKGQVKCAGHPHPSRSLRRAFASNPRSSLVPRSIQDQKQIKTFCLCLVCGIATVRKLTMPNPTRHRQISTDQPINRSTDITDSPVTSAIYKDTIDPQMRGQCCPEATPRASGAVVRCPRV